MKPVTMAMLAGAGAAAVTAGVLIWVVPHLQRPTPPAQPVNPVVAQAPAAPRMAPAPPAPRPLAAPVPAVAAAPYPPAYAPRAPARARRSPYQGTVVSVRTVYVGDSVSPGGVLLGGIAGAVIGHQVGNGNGRTAATVAGAIGGALLGNHIGEQVTRRKMYDIVVRRDTGGRVTLEQSRYVPPGQRVRLANGQAIPD